MMTSAGAWCTRGAWMRIAPVAAALPHCAPPNAFTIEKVKAPSSKIIAMGYQVHHPGGSWLDVSRPTAATRDARPTMVFRMSPVSPRPFEHPEPSDQRASPVSPRHATHRAGGGRADLTATQTDNTPIPVLPSVPSPQGAVHRVATCDACTACAPGRPGWAVHAFP